jgi:hypothetical protein
MLRAGQPSYHFRANSNGWKSGSLDLLSLYFNNRKFILIWNYLILSYKCKVADLWPTESISIYSTIQTCLSSMHFNSASHTDRTNPRISFPLLGRKIMPVLCTSHTPFKTLPVDDHPTSARSTFGQSVWDLWGTKWNLDRFPSECFGFPLSSAFHQCSTLVFFPPPPTYVILAVDSIVKVNIYRSAWSSRSAAAVSISESSLLTDLEFRPFSFTKLLLLWQETCCASEL